MSRAIHWSALMLAAAAVCPVVIAAAKGAPAPAERRAALLQAAEKGAAAVPQLVAALKDENLAVRRTAVRLLATLGAPARPALGEALGNSDFVVRRAALWAVCDPLTTASLPSLERALRDPHEEMRRTAAQMATRIEPRTEGVTALLERARADEVPAVRDIAARALWPFHKEVTLVRDRKDWDHDIVVAQTIPLPKTDWRFRTDPKLQGHVEKWFEPALDDKGWTPIEIEQAWEKQAGDYDGIAWYRGSFDLPARPDHLAVEVCFEAVDEGAWVWVNGRYAGQHDIGPDGWTKPFALDITQDVRWGERNQITVRVQDTAGAGGIWKPARIEVLK